MLSRGKSPRVALRYGFRPGLVLHYRLTSEQRLLGASGRAQPQIRHLSFAVDRVRGPRAQVRWRQEPGPGIALPGRALWMQLSDRGVVEAIAMGRGEDKLDAWLGQALQSMYPRFPKEALGAGARWQETRNQELRPLPGRPAVGTRLKAQYALERFAPCGRTRCAEISVRMEVGLTHSVGPRHLQGEGWGRGHLRFDLGRGSLVSSSTFSEMEIRVAASGGQARELIRTRSDLEEVRGLRSDPKSGATLAPDARPSAPGSRPRAAPPGR